MTRATTSGVRSGPWSRARIRATAACRSSGVGRRWGTGPTGEASFSVDRSARRRLCLCPAAALSVVSMQCTMLPRVESCSKPVDCVGRRGGRCRGGSSAHAGQSLRRGEGRAGVPHARATVSSRAMCPRLLRNASQASGEVYAAAPRRCATTWSPTTASASAGPRSPAGWERASGNPSTVTPGMADGSCGMATAASSWTRCSTCGRARPVPSHPSHVG